jgi:TonB family protein
LQDGLSLAELATTLSAHGGGGLSADLALDLVLNEIVEDARLATGATAAAIALARGDDIVCRATTGANAPDLGVRLEVNSGLSGACVQSRKSQRCDDTETDPRVDAEICRELGVRSILVFPVLREDHLFGVVEIFSPRPSAFSDREIQTLEALSRGILNNIDRAAHVVEPPPPVLPSSAAAATVTPVAEVAPQIDQPQIDSAQIDLAQIDQPQIDSAQIDLAHVDQPQIEPAQIESAQTDLAQIDHPHIGQPQRDTLAPAIDALPATTGSPKIHPRDHWMTVLTVIVIGVALFLGWMLGYGGRQKAPAGTNGKAAANPTVPAAETKPPQSPAASPNSAAANASGQPASAPLPTAPVLPQKSSPGVVSAGGLVVYENGKVIFRTPPQSLRTSARDTIGQPVVVPSKVADEYLLQRVEPEYPDAAREQHIQGPVVLVALVGKDGAVEKLSTLKGDSRLVPAATGAVRQWRFKPFFRNGAPEEFQTQITVSFRLP